MTPNAPDTRLGAHHWSLGAGAQHIAGVVDLLATNQPKWWMRMTWVIKCPHFSHHPTKIGIWSMPWLLFTVMSNIPKMGQANQPPKCNPNVIFKKMIVFTGDHNQKITITRRL